MAGRTLSSSFLPLCLLLSCFALPPQDDARNLSRQLNGLFGGNGIWLDVQKPTENPWNPGTFFPSHTAHFSSDSLARLGLLVQQLAPNAADFPALSTAPGFTYIFNPELDEFERSSNSLASVFVERPRTIGAGRFALGVSYAFVDFQELDGEDLDGLNFSLAHGDCCQASGAGAPGEGFPSHGDPIFEKDTADIIFEKFSLESHVMSFFGTYGISERWDINFLLPVIFTSLDVRALARLNYEASSEAFGHGIHFFDNEAGITLATDHIDSNKAGVGDLLLRTKYHLVQYAEFNAAAGLALRLPTGDEDNFQGLGDTIVSPFFGASYEYDRFHLHMSGGIDINSENLDRSRARYGLGASYHVIEELALIVDIIGSSQLATDKLSVEIAQHRNDPVTGEIFELEPVTQTAGLRTDIIDLAIGFKFVPFDSFALFAQFLVPLNDDGLRTDFIPMGGLELSF